MAATKIIYQYGKDALEQLKAEEVRAHQRGLERLRDAAQKALETGVTSGDLPNDMAAVLHELGQTAARIGLIDRLMLSEGR